MTGQRSNGDRGRAAGRSWAAPMVAALVLALAACGGAEGEGTSAGPATSDPTTSQDSSGDDVSTTSGADTDEGRVAVRMAWGSEAFWEAPFPCASRVRDGRVEMGGFPNPRRNRFVRDLLALLESAEGFGVTSGVFLPLTGGVDGGSLPRWEESVAEGATVYLARVDRGEVERVAVTVMFEEDGGPFGAPNLLSLVPVQGVVLAPGGTYAAVVTPGVRDEEGQALQRAPELTALLDALESGGAVEGLGEEAMARYGEAVAALDGAGEVAGVVGLAVFRTEDGREGMARAVAQVRELELPVVGEWEAREVFDGFCVVEGRVELPVYQGGTPPFTSGGGGWVVGEDGALVQQAVEEARVVVTMPRGEMPAGGWPTVVFVRTGGGGDRPLVDRGVRAEPGGEAVEEGTGYAREFAEVGFAGVSVDGPHGGLRNVTGGDEQFLIFNVTNPAAMRDNIRQSALELVLLARMLPQVEVPGDLCEGASAGDGGVFRLDGDRVALFGHSMGATIAPLALAYAPRYRAAILSGAGGSWIANVVHKQQPLEVRPLAELTLGYIRRRLHEHDVALTLLQWAGEAADPPLYGRILQDNEQRGAPLHVLMLQGIADTYILPPMANALSLSVGLDLGGAALDREHPVAGQFTPLEDVLPLVGGAVLDLPVAGNRGDRTAVVVQHLEDGIEDGHEVAFQLDAPKAQVRAFLAAFASGEMPVVE